MLPLLSLLAPVANVALDTLGSFVSKAIKSTANPATSNLKELLLSQTKTQSHITF